MAVTQLDPLTVLLANIYLVMIVQLILNWQAANCGTSSYLFQLAFILIMAGRLVLQEFYNNKIMPKKIFASLMFLSSGVLLLGLGIYQSYTISTHSSDFFYDANTKTGSEVCFQNRIIFVGEIIIGFLTLFKDIYFIGIVKEDEQSIQE